MQPGLFLFSLLLLILVQNLSPLSAAAAAALEFPSTFSTWINPSFANASRDVAFRISLLHHRRLRLLQHLEQQLLLHLQLGYSRRRHLLLLHLIVAIALKSTHGNA